MTQREVPWAREVPAHWEVRTLGSHFAESRKRNVGLAESNLLSLSYGRIVRRDIGTSEGLLPESFETYQIVEPNDMVFRFTDLQNDQRSLRSARVTERGIITSAYVAASPRNIDPRYAEYLMRSYDLVKVFYALGSGVRQTLKFADVQRLPLLYPPPDEQRTIADYLDRETVKIDTLIAEQSRLVEMLQERRIAVADQSLAYGLDSVGRTRETGDPRLPFLPIGWQAVRTKRVLSFGPSNGVSPEAGMIGDLKTLSLGAVRDGRVKMSDDVTKFVDRMSVARVDELRLRPDDILLVRGNGNVDLVARAGLVGSEFDTEEYIYPDLLIRIRANALMVPKFLVWAFNSTAARAQIRSKARTAVGTFKVSASDVREMVVPLPPLSEQRRIVAHLEEATAEIDTLIGATERFIELARERRSALVTAAVTGQVDVSEAA